MDKIPVPKTEYVFKGLYIGVDLDEQVNWEKHMDSIWYKVIAGMRGGGGWKNKTLYPTQNFTRCLQNSNATDFYYSCPLG